MDMTDRPSRPRPSLANRPELVERLMELLPGAVFFGEYEVGAGWIYDTAYESPGIEAITGRSPEDLLANPGSLAELVHPDDRERFLEAMERAAREHGEGEMEYRVRNARTGEYRWVLERFRGAAGDRPGRSFVIGILMDVSETHAAVDALREAEERMRVLVEGTPYLFFYTQNEKGDVTYVSPSVEAITGYSVERWKGQRHWFVTDNPINDAARRRTHDHLRGEEPDGPFEVEIEHADGHPILLEIYEHPVRRNGRVVGIQGVARDINEKRKLQEELVHSRKMEATGRLAAGLAHDLNNMLQGILTAAELARLRLDDSSPAQPWMEQILKLTERGSNLISRLLSYARRQMLQRIRTDLNELVREATDLVDSMVGDDVTVKKNLFDGRLAVLVDPAQITNAIINLADNARDAMPNGGEILIETRKDDDGREAVLRFSDTGRGIEEENLTRIFEPFFTTKGIGQGTGLGLSSVLGSIEQHGGSVEVESRLGEGTTFTIRLPLIDEAELDREEAAAARRAIRPRTILLVEDNEAVIEVMAEVLEEDGYRVLQCTSLDEARRQLGEGSPVDVVVSDLQLPDGSGATLAQVTSLPLILMSGYPLGSLPPGMQNVPPDVVFLEKPFQVSQLERAIEALFPQNHPH